ncbi:MAG: GAF domain-containing protein [Acidimicrobiia bacterium]
MAPHVRLEELVAALQERTGDAMVAERLRVLLDAVLAVATGLSIPEVLRAIVEGACRLADARYGALGVIGSDGQLSAFITVGIDDETRARIGDEPRGHGILGLLVRDPQPLMLRDLRDHPASVGFPPNHPPMRSFLGVPVRARDSVFGNLYLCEKESAEEFTATDQELVSALAVAAGVALENASLYAEQRRREEWLDSVAAISRDLLGGAQIDTVLGDIAVRAGSIARADAVRVMVAGDDGRKLTIVATHGPYAAATAGMAVPVEGTAAGDAYLTGETQVVLDASQDSRVFLPAIEALHPGPVVYAPFRGADRVFGVLSVDNAKGGRPFEALDIEVIGSFAGQAGLAIEVARSRGNRDRVRMLEDRERIGRNLHDTVVQRLFAVGMLLQATITDRSGVDPERISKAIDEIDATIKEIRSSIFTLAKPTTTGVRAEIIDVVESYAEGAGFEPHVVFDGPVDTAIPSAVAPHLIAVAREAVSNASRHAHPHRVDVSLAVTDEIVLRVCDDGIGLPQGQDRRSGLANLEARAVELGGSLDVTSQPGGGTRVTWRVPFVAAEMG